VESAAAATGEIVMAHPSTSSSFSESTGELDALIEPTPDVPLGNLWLERISRDGEMSNGKLYGGTHRVVRHRNGTDSLGNRHRIEELSGVTHP
jgi:hypothetical protein